MELEKFELLKKEFLSRKSKFDVIERYYRGETDAKINYKDTERANLFITNNYLKKFVKEETSYSVGNPISYASKSSNDGVIENLNSILEDINENHDINTFRNMVLYGCSYELIYVKENKSLGIKTVPPTKGYAQLDEEGKVLGFIREYKVLDKTYYDYYDETTICVLSDSLELIEQKDNIFGYVPVNVALLSEDEWKDTIYADIKGLQDALETNMSDITNEISDFRNAYLTLVGLSIDEGQAQEFKENGIIEIPVSDGKAEWLIKNINDSFIQNTIQTLKQQLYELTSHINHNDIEQSSNASGVALKSKLISLMQRCVYNQNAYNELLKQRLGIIADYCIKVGKATFDWKDIKITYTPCIPSDDLQTAQMIQMLDGKVSNETLLTLLSFVENASEEAEKVKKQIEEGNIQDYTGFNQDPEGDLGE